MNKLTIAEIILTGSSFLGIISFFIPNFLISKLKIYNVIIVSILLLLGISIFLIEWYRRKK